MQISHTPKYPYRTNTTEGKKGGQKGGQKGAKKARQAFKE